MRFSPPRLCGEAGFNFDFYSIPQYTRYIHRVHLPGIPYLQLQSFNTRSVSQASKRIWVNSNPLLLCELVVLLRTEREHRRSSDSHHSLFSFSKHSRTTCNRPSALQHSTHQYNSSTLVSTRVRQQEQAEEA